MAEEERMIKMEVDYCEIVDKAIPECEALAMDNKLNEAIDKLLVLEKQTRGVSKRDICNIYVFVIFDTALSRPPSCKLWELYLVCRK